MNWRPIDFQGIIDLDPKIVEQLDHYLQEKETRLAHQILNAIQSFTSESSHPVLPISAPLKLIEAVDTFSKNVRLFSKSSLNSEEDWNLIVKKINTAFWEFTEVLEGSVVELFQQIDQVPIIRWHLTLPQVVQGIKEILLHRIEDLIWAIKRLEKPINDMGLKYRTRPYKWFEWLGDSNSKIDPKLPQNLNQTEVYLKKKYNAFNEIYREYMSLNLQVEGFLENMKSFPILALMEMNDQNVYVDVFRLLKMLEIIGNPKKKISEETTQALKNLNSVDAIRRVFRIYFEGLNEAFFSTSLEWKSLNSDHERYREVSKKLQNKVKEFEEELSELKYTMSRYRTFILKNDPNPYIGSQWGFTEWMVGPEPGKSKKILHLLYSAEDLERDYQHFYQSLIRDPSVQKRNEEEAKEEIEKLLHEMGQPLISQSMMRKRGEELLNQLKKCDEAGSPRHEIIFYVESVLSKAMRSDWKYHVLHEFPLFHQIYQLHQGLWDHFEDPSHTFRKEKLNNLLIHISEWAEKDNLYRHVNEIELDLNDMKTYLQDFLAFVQRVAKKKSEDPFLDETIHKYQQQLLEYRYLFGQFFHELLKRNSNGLQLRNQFLFVDQYFEAVENILNELVESWEGKSQR